MTRFGIIGINNFDVTSLISSDYRLLSVTGVFTLPSKGYGDNS